MRKLFSALSLALFLLPGLTPTALAEEAMPAVGDLDSILPVTSDPDLRVIAMIGAKAIVETPRSQVTVYAGDLVRYRGTLYRVVLDGEHLALLGLEGQDSVLLPVRETGAK